MEDNEEVEGERNEADDRGGGGDDHAADSDEEEQQFDISLAATHSYMGPGLVGVGGRVVLEAGWVGRVPVLAHHGTVFPGETVPMLLPDSHDAAVLSRAIKQDKLFGLLCPNEGGTLVSGYGVLCEVFEAGLTSEADDSGELAERPAALSFKARATHRFRFVDMPRHAVPVHMYARVRLVDVRVLPEVQLGDPLRPARLASLDHRRQRHSRWSRVARAMDATVTPWPLFVYDIFDYRRMRRLIKDYFKTVMLVRPPADAVSLSFWAASNLPLAARDRLALFVVDNALQRLHMEISFINKTSVLCCAACRGQIARREHIFAMSTEGVHSNYTNLGGYMHDIVTVSRATNTELTGAASAEYSWFPGYTWTIALCVGCMAHVGWRFDAIKRNLRPLQFYGLCRNYVQPSTEGEERLRTSTPPLPVR